MHREYSLIFQNAIRVEEDIAVVVDQGHEQAFWVGWILEEETYHLLFRIYMLVLFIMVVLFLR